MNPINMIKNFMKKGMSPQQILINTVSGNNSNPMVENLINMAQNGDSKGIENFARNMFKEKGRDFDKEFSDFMNQMKG